MARDAKCDRYDVWYVLRGQPQAYIPGLYEIAFLLFMLGAKKAKAHGLWEDVNNLMSEKWKGSAGEWATKIWGAVALLPVWGALAAFLALIWEFR